MPHTRQWVANKGRQARHPPFVTEALSLHVANLDLRHQPLRIYTFEYPSLPTRDALLLADDSCNMQLRSHTVLSKGKRQHANIDVSLASNNTTLSLEQFVDKSNPQGTEHKNFCSPGVVLVLCCTCNIVFRVGCTGSNGRLSGTKLSPN